MINYANVTNTTNHIILKTMKYFIFTMDNYGIFQWIYNEKLRKTIITLLILWDYNAENNVNYVRCIIIINFDLIKTWCITRCKWTPTDGKLKCVSCLGYSVYLSSQIIVLCTCVKHWLFLMSLLLKGSASHPLYPLDVTLPFSNQIILAPAYKILIKIIRIIFSY